MIGICDKSKEIHKRRSHDQGNALAYRGIDGWRPLINDKSGRGFKQGDTVEIHLNFL